MPKTWADDALNLGHSRKCERCGRIFFHTPNLSLARRGLDFTCQDCRKQPEPELRLPLPRQDFYLIERGMARSTKREPLSDQADRRHRPRRNVDSRKRRKRVA